MDERIKSILKELPNIPPDISKEFVEVIQYLKRKSFVPTGGDLVKLRTVIYYTLYFKRKSSMDKKQDIKRFIFGNSHIGNQCNRLVDDASGLWNKLSGDPKVGRSNGETNKIIFMELIDNLEQILVARKKLHR